MSNFEDVQRIALSLADTEEVDSRFKVRGKNFAAVYPEKLEGRRSRVPNFDVLVTWVADLHTKQALLAAEPEIFFTTDHYNNYPIVLTRLALVDEDRLTELLADGWESRQS
jgi:hypothetical protein